MKNWAGNIQWAPETVQYPESEAQIQQLVRQAAEQRRPIRMIGTGHSFTALCATDAILISLDHYQGITAIDQDTMQATVRAGTKLRSLGEALFQHGLAMENLGDIDAQSIAGTISTGTHGTGINFGTISTQVVSIRFVNGQGEIIECGPTQNPDLFKAAQVSLGTLGIITCITLQCVPAYKLALQNRKEKLEAVLTNLPDRLTQNRNFEYYWMPYTSYAWTKTSQVVEAATPDKVNVFNYWTEYVLENYVFQLFCDFAYWFPSQNKTVSHITAASINNIRKVYHSHKVYATKRLVRFKEMEYNIPAEAYQEVWKAIRKTVNSKKFNIHFPIENRWVKGDDIYLSPAYQRDSAYIACHVYHKKDHRPYFKAMEEIFIAHGGRPHWGKMHTQRAAELSASYPAFSAFLKHRHEQDPDGIFLNTYLKQILGI